MKFRMRYADQIVGIFTIAAMAGLVLLIFFLGSRQKWFVRKYHYVTEFKTASNISRNMAVQYKGFTIGKIDRIALVDDKVTVNFYVLEDYIQYVKKGSLVELVVSPIGLGTQFVFYPGKGSEILAAGSSVPRLDSPEGQQIISEHLAGLTPQKDSVSELVSQVTHLLGNLNQMTDTVNLAIDGASDTPIGQILLNLSSITRDLRILSKTVSDPDGLVPLVLGVSDKRAFADQIQKILSDISAVTGNIDALSENADGLITDARPQLVSVLSEVTTVLLDIQDVMTGLKNNPLIKKGVPDRNSTNAAVPQLRNNDF